YTINKTSIPPHSRKLVAIGNKKGLKLNLPNHDLLYEPQTQNILTSFPQVISGECNSVLVQNDNSNEQVIPAYHLMGHIVDTEINLMIAVTESEVYHLMPSPVKNASLPILLVKGTLAMASANLGMCTLDTKSNTNIRRHESKLPNGVTIFGNFEEQELLKELVDEFKVIWTDRGCFAKPPNDHQMTIELKENWEELYKPGQARVYKQGLEEQAIIDKTHDKLHKQGRLYWTTKSTPFSFPVFVVWKIVNGECKGRVVVDRDLETRYL
ncbi:hypothetical protein OnM2_088033, partial [Erysiphe neolycopersici]